MNRQREGKNSVSEGDDAELELQGGLRMVLRPRVVQGVKTGDAKVRKNVFSPPNPFLFADEAELARLQRQYRMAEGDRKAYNDEANTTIRKQVRGVHRDAWGDHAPILVRGRSKFGCKQHLQEPCGKKPSF